MPATLSSIDEKQIKKINRLIERAEFDYESDAEKQASVYKLYAKRFGIIIVVSWKSDEDEFTILNTEDGKPIYGSKLDIKLNEIIEAFRDSERTLEHVQNTDKIKSITVTANSQPSSKIIQEILQKVKIDIPFAIQAELGSKCMQRAHEKYSNLSAEDQILKLIEIESEYKVIQDLISKSFQKRNAKAYSEISQIHTIKRIKADRSAIKPNRPKASELKATKSKMSKTDQSVWNILPKDATTEQFNAKKQQMIALGILIEESAPKGEKFKIETTKSTETTYDGNTNKKDKS